MLHFVFDPPYAVEIESGVRPQQLRGLGRDLAQPGQRLGGRQLHFQPLREFVLVGPDAAHLRAACTLQS